MIAPANPTPRVTVIIPARNEMGRWPQVIEYLRAQTRAPDEIVVADGSSTDGSREWLDDLASRDRSLTVVDNPARIVPAALNVALAHATGDIVARMDTHADYAPDYLETVVDFLVSHPEVAGVGGAMETKGVGPWGQAIAATLRRPFGLGGARHRIGGSAGPIPHVFSGCYRRDALLAAGGWDERLRANEDFEADVRIAATGKAVWLEPAAHSIWYTRESPGALMKQMWRYGFYKGLTLHLHPASLQVRQLAPPALVGALLLGPLVNVRATAALGAAYGAAAATLGARAARADGASPVRGAAIPAIVHLSWGSGLIAGLLRFAWSADRSPVRPRTSASQAPSEASSQPCHQLVGEGHR
jgi:succinoglycan biosynthesis protein ExoA